MTITPAASQRQSIQASPHAIPGGPRIIAPLNQGWSFKRIESGEALTVAPTEPGFDPHRAGWESVTLPHSVRLEPLNASGCRNFQGICWYTRPLAIPPDWVGRTIYLHLEGAMQVCDLWLNGRQLPTHFGGYTPIVYDITEHLTPGGPNVLTIRLDNTDQPDVPPGKPQAELDFAYFGGLYRNVRLEVVDPLHISDPIHADRIAGGGVFVTYPRVDAEQAQVSIRTDLRNADARPRGCLVRQQLIDAAGTCVAETSEELLTNANAYSSIAQSLQVDRPTLWHPDAPTLYTLRTTLLADGRPIDEIQTHIGLRRIEFTVDRGLLINGEKFFSFGANRHQDHPYVGYALSDAAQWREAQTLRDAGFTSFRSHYPQSPAFMDACDALGILAIVSNPGWQFVGGEVFQRRALQNARLMVRRDRNRPSVILWEAALNESDNRTLAGALHDAIHEEYPAPGCYTAGDRNAHFVGPAHAGTTPPSVWDIDYLHNDGTKPHWVREWGDRVDNWSDQQSANRVNRAWGEGPMLTQALSHLRQMDDLMQQHHGSPTGDRLAGACLWAAVDCQRGYHHQPFLGGALDVMRLPKFNYHLFQSQRSAGHGPTVFIANFATFLSPTAVTVFSNCEQVRLTLNGHEVATQSPDAGHRVPHPPFTFQVDRFSSERSTMFMNPTDPGTTGAPPELKAEGLIGGRVVVSHIVRPPGQPKQLTLRVDTAGHELIADGADFVRVHAAVCDARGTICPTADDWIHFTVTGAATVIDAPGLHANPFRAETGIASALIRATHRPGPITITATAFGLTPATLSMQSVAS